MRKGRRLFVGGLVSAGLSLLVAPRVAGSRRAALSRLRARGSASGAFAGTPCSLADPAAVATSGGSGPSPAPPAEPPSAEGRAGRAPSDPKEDA